MMDIIDDVIVPGITLFDENIAMCEEVRYL